MTVRAVTPRLPALHGHTYVHAAGCAGDCCNYDALTDDIATGEPFDVDYQPPMGHGVHRFLGSPSVAATLPATGVASDGRTLSSKPSGATPTPLRETR